LLAAFDVSEDRLCIRLRGALPAHATTLAVSLEDTLLPDAIHAVLVPCDASQPVRSVVIPATGCVLSALAAALRAPAVAPSQPLGARPKAGRPREEPRLYVPFDPAAEALHEAPQNARASWLAGAPLRGDALLAHAALPQRAATAAAVCLRDVSVQQYDALALATLPAAMHAASLAAQPAAPALPRHYCPDTWQARSYQVRFCLHLV
jgi:hypothetical protein